MGTPHNLGNLNGMASKGTPLEDVPPYHLGNERLGAAESDHEMSVRSPQILNDGLLHPIVAFTEYSSTLCASFHPVGIFLRRGCLARYP